MIKKGDNVTVLKGGDKGKSAKVLKVFPKKSLIVVEGVNMKKKHQRARKRGEKGQIIERPMPLHISNVKIKN